MRILVCGGRRFSRPDRLWQVLGELHQRTPFSVLIHGGAPGADSLAGRWARSQGVSEQVFVADWQRYGRAAGPLRNQKMLEQGQPDLVVAFPGGPGTRNMLQQAQQAGVAIQLAGNKPGFER